MEERAFHLRSRAIQEGDANEQLSLHLEIDTEEGWQPVTLGTAMPPFRAFLCSALMCQQAYLRMNAAERGVALREARGDLRIKTEDWFVRELHAHFRVTLRGGAASAEDIAFISERMRDCPVSRNLEGAKKETIVEVVSTFD